MSVNDFLNYLGPVDSLYGYQKSYKLVLFKCFFECKGFYDYVKVDDVVKRFKNYYIQRKNCGLIPDIGSNSIIKHIENSSDEQVFSLIISKPFKVISEKGFLSIITKSNINYFILPISLIRLMHDDDYKKVKEIINAKLDLYFSKIDCLQQNDEKTNKANLNEKIYKLLKKHPDGCNIKSIAKALEVDEKEINFFLCELKLKNKVYHDSKFNWYIPELYLAKISCQLASHCKKEGDFQKALVNYKRSVKIQEKILGIKNKNTRETYYKIASTYYELGDINSSLEYCGKVNDSQAVKKAEINTKIEAKNTQNEFDYNRIEEPKKIIESKIYDRIIVNAGPGTGKTYTVIKRLGYIINNKLINPASVVVLCYSRSAVGVIRNRINEEIDAGEMTDEARQLFEGIRTFDSFATLMLSDDEIEGTLNNLDYDERIEKFITELKKDKTIFDKVEYLIVDEMQDLVGVRARMVKEILKCLKCGFLLLGDKCQSIYDFIIQDENELNSNRFYEWIDDYFGLELKRYELIKNVRQRKKLADLSFKMREDILSAKSSIKDETPSYINDLINNEKDVKSINSSKSIILNNTAVLCRNNAEVSIISSQLFKEDVEHRVFKKAQHIDLVPWIAEILSTYTENKIGYNAFKKRVNNAGYEDVNKKWQLLKTIAVDDSEKVLDLKLLLKALVSGKDLPNELDLASTEKALVSTIHRSKGREYEKIILLEDDFKKNYTSYHKTNTLDEMKVSYVALTRARKKINFCKLDKIHYCKQLNSKRWIGTGYSNKNHKKFCKNIELGLCKDINPYSFVDEEISFNDNIKNVEERQKYISKLKPGDSLCSYSINKHKSYLPEYYLFHEGNCVGLFSEQIYFELKDAMHKTNRSPVLPNLLTDIYVNNIVTIANTKYNENLAAPYSKSGLWLGIEVSGFASTKWD